eukprot:Gb_10926 [translate_table: standard]
MSLERILNQLHGAACVLCKFEAELIDRRGLALMPLLQISLHRRSSRHRGRLGYGAAPLPCHGMPGPPPRTTDLQRGAPPPSPPMRRHGQFFENARLPQPLLSTGSGEPMRLYANVFGERRPQLSAYISFGKRRYRIPSSNPPPIIRNPLQYGSYLRVLSVGYNKLQGPLPHWITNLTTLQVLDLSYNGFTGTLPPNLKNLQGFGKLGDPQAAGNTFYEQLSEQRNTNEHRNSQQPSIAQSLSEPLWGTNPCISWYNTYSRAVGLVFQRVKREDSCRTLCFVFLGQ